MDCAPPPGREPRWLAPLRESRLRLTGYRQHPYRAIMTMIDPPGQPAAPIWRVVKTYGHAEGLSCCFRQWQAAASHCRFLHGYALGFRFTFACRTLDDRGWCIDFGGLKPLRAWLHEQFDHTTLVAADDPARAAFEAMAGQGLMQLRLLPAVGSEAFAQHAFAWAQAFARAETDGRVCVEQVEVSEHSGNVAVYGRL